MIKIVTNSLGTGDWIEVIRETDVYDRHDELTTKIEKIFSGHSISADDLHHILNVVQHDEVKLVMTDDEGMSLCT